MSSVCKTPVTVAISLEAKTQYWQLLTVSLFSKLLQFFIIRLSNCMKLFSIWFAFYFPQLTDEHARTRSVSYVERISFVSLFSHTIQWCFTMSVFEYCESIVVLVWVQKLETRAITYFLEGIDCETCVKQPVR